MNHFVSQDVRGIIVLTSVHLLYLIYAMDRPSFVEPRFFTNQVLMLLTLLQDFWKG